MRPWHWFLNRPSFRFTVDPDVAALIQRLRLQATLFPVPNPTRYGRHTHSSFKQTKAAHNDQACHYGQLIWSGPGHGGFISVMPHTHCVSQPQYAVSVCVCACARVRIRLYTNKFGPESLEYCTSFNCHLHSGRIVTFWILTACLTAYTLIPLLPPSRHTLVSMSGPASVTPVRHVCLFVVPTIVLSHNLLCGHTTAIS